MDRRIGAVQKPEWRPPSFGTARTAVKKNVGSDNEGGFDWKLASCSLDHGVWILRVVWGGGLIEELPFSPRALYHRFVFVDEINVIIFVV